MPKTPFLPGNLRKDLVSTCSSGLQHILFRRRGPANHRHLGLHIIFRRRGPTNHRRLLFIFKSNLLNKLCVCREGHLSEIHPQGAATFLSLFLSLSLGRQNTALLSPQYPCLWNHGTHVCSVALTRSSSCTTLCMIVPSCYFWNIPGTFLTSFVSDSKIRTTCACSGILDNRLLQ